MIDFSQKYWKLIIIGLLITVIITGCSIDEKEEQQNQTKEGDNELNKKLGSTRLPAKLKERKEEIVDKYQNRKPQEWGENVSGVITKLDTDKKIVALTLDACGGPNDGYDSKLINYLKQEEIPATLFINSRWIDDQPEIFRELAEDSLFTIANHGTRHLPLSVTGKSAYGIQGTTSVEAVVDEVINNEVKIKKISGRKPEYFRAGTAYYDEVAVGIVNELGEKVIGYDTLGDAGATFSKQQVKQACLSVGPGSIILAHMNHPESDTAEGIRAAVPELRSRGFRFVKLADYDEQLIKIKNE